ncbi:MAG: serine/threonine protein kinase [Planctomycetes bacterium]|nr:serine/threonine protein kinase [Planctomycetota bacterium]
MFRAKQRLDKYRIERKIAEGGFAAVYQAFDTIEGVRVALKIPHPHLVSPSVLSLFRREVRLAATLDHPNILPLKNASFIGEHLVIVFALGEETLADRLRRRLSLTTALDYAEQMLEAAAYAHDRRIIHCDIKPENLLLFPGNRLRLTDFGIARVALRTIRASGSGTVGYIAPEQAVGRPSLRSDVFSIGLIIYRMLSGTLPEWPYRWPPEGIERIRRKLHPDMIKWLRKAMEPNPRKRFDDARQMLNAYKRLKPRVRRYATARRSASAGTTRRT